MEYSKQEQQKMNAEGILANQKTINQLRQINMGVHCGFVHCGTCPFHRNNLDTSCGFVAINRILDELVA
jgi:hypothetical protein